MAIRRSKRESNFTMISNVGLKDKRLSFKAKGLLAYMLSLPDDWVFYESEIVNHATDGKQSVRTGMKELEQHGYLVREQRRSNKGEFANVDWIVSDEPLSADATTFQPSTDLPSADKPSTDNQTLLSTKELSTNKQSTDSPAKAEPPIPYKKIIGYLNEKADRNFSHIAKSNKDLIKARWNGLKRLNKSATDEELYQSFITVIDNKTEDAQDPNHFFKEEYLRPSTLFKESNFDKYLNQPSRRKPKENRTSKTNWDELESLVYGEGD